MTTDLRDVVFQTLRLERGYRRRSLAWRWFVGPLVGFKVDAEGFRLKLDARDSLGLGFHRTHEPDITRLVEDQLSPGDVFVDVGANIGWHSLHASRAVGPSGRVISLEPELHNFALLARNLAQNEVANAIPIRIGAGSATGSFEIELDDANFGAHRFGRGQRITVVRVEDVCRMLGVTPALVKIDVEGAEPAVIDGLGELLGTVALVLEFFPSAQRQLGGDPDALLELLQDAYGNVSVVERVGDTYALRAVGAELVSSLGDRYTHLLCR